jgi:hypothetical protein
LEITCSFGLALHCIFQPATRPFLAANWAAQYPAFISILHYKEGTTKEKKYKIEFTQKKKTCMPSAYRDQAHDLKG